MENETNRNRETANRNISADRLSRKANRKNLIVILGLFLVLFIVSAVILGYIYLVKSDYEKGTNYLKDKKYTEALYEFQKVGPDDKDFSDAQSKINYINGLLNFNSGKNNEAIVFLSKVKPEDEYYHDSQLMLDMLNNAETGNDLQAQIDSLKSKKDTVIIKKEVTVNNEKIKEPVDPTKQADLEISRKYVSDAGNSISRFDGIYQTARTAPLNTKSDYSKSLESADKQFNNLKYTAQNKDAGVLELKRLVSQWMNKRIAFIRQLIIEKSAGETDLSRPIKEEGDRLYSAMMSQMKKVKKSF